MTIEYEVIRRVFRCVADEVVVTGGTSRLTIRMAIGRKLSFLAARRDFVWIVNDTDRARFIALEPESTNDYLKALMRLILDDVSVYIMGLSVIRPHDRWEKLMELTNSVESFTTVTALRKGD